MKPIASNDYYSLEVDPAKNRLYLAYKGSWIKAQEVGAFVEDHQKALDCLTAGFTTLVDVRPMEAMLLTDFVEAVQKQAVDKGIRKAARVYTKEGFIKTQADRINVRTGIRSRAFFRVDEAEAWLDEP